MNPSRRTFLLFTGAAAATRFATGQYVLPPQPLPSERFPPSPEQLAARDLQQRVGNRLSRPVEYLALDAYETAGLDRPQPDAEERADRL